MSKYSIHVCLTTMRVFLVVGKLVSVTCVVALVGRNLSVVNTNCDPHPCSGM